MCVRYLEQVTHRQWMLTEIHFRADTHRLLSGMSTRTCTGREDGPDSRGML